MRMIKLLLVIALTGLSLLSFSQKSEVVSASSEQNSLNTGSVPKPEMSSTNEQLWFWYWEDQFKVNKGNVNVPDSSYNDVANVSFFKAKKDYNKLKKENKIYYAYFGVLAVVLIVPLFIF